MLISLEARGCESTSVLGGAGGGNHSLLVGHMGTRGQVAVKELYEQLAAGRSSKGQ